MCEVPPLQDDSAALASLVKVSRKDWETYHLWPTDLEDFTCSSLDCRLTPDHVATIAEHCDANKGVAVLVPVKNWPVLFRETADSVFSCFNRVSFCPFCLAFQLVVSGLHAHVDVSNLKVHVSHQINAGDA